MSAEADNFKPKNIIGVRHLQFFLLFLTFVVFFSQRSAMSVAIIAMTEESPSNPNIPTYPHWGYRDAILSSFFWGYMIPQVAAGQLSEYFGAKWFLCASGVLGSVFNILVPVMAENFHEGGVIASRVLQGFTQGFFFPGIHTMISQWSPSHERSRVSAFVFAGISLGTVVSMPVSGAIAGSQLGWPSIFYFFGGAGLVWGVVFAVFASDSPSKHPRVAEDEKQYIQSSNSVTITDKKIPTPWSHIVTSLPVWTILISRVGDNWGFFVLLTEIPSYMDGIMNFDIESNGLLSALPYTVMFLMSLIVGPVADKLITTRTLSVGATRKVFSSIGTLVPAATLFTLGFIKGSQKEIAITLLVIAVAATACSNAGFLVNNVDISPNHAGTLSGITSCVAVTSSILGPLSTGFFDNKKDDPMLWRKVFWIAAGIYVVSGVFFAVFASGEVQKWNDLTEVKKQNVNKTKSAST